MTTKDQAIVDSGKSAQVNAMLVSAVQFLLGASAPMTTQQKECWPGLEAALTAAQQAQPEPAYAQVGEDGNGQENHCPDCGAEPGQMCSSVEGVEWGRRVHASRQQAQPVCGYDDTTGNCTRVNCCKQAQPSQYGSPELQALILAKLQPERAPSDDTARIDFMEKNGKSNVFSIGGEWYTRIDYGQPYTKHKSLRDAIDAAIKQGGQQ